MNTIHVIYILTDLIALMCDDISLAKITTKPRFHNAKCKFYHEPIGNVRYINIQAWLRGFRVKIANFSSFFCPSIPIRDLDTKETTPNIDV